ncbi:MAG: hypothetical protein HY817_02795 [Candidatus Abawacabacteria bacterium]|nr:hypothetical protein [Candidatus Abawacabacteria bacterium]
MINKGLLRLEIETPNADIAKMIRAVFTATGDDQPFFCPTKIVEGEPYKGHVHVFPPTAATNIAIRKIFVGSQ